MKDREAIECNSEINHAEIQVLKQIILECEQKIAKLEEYDPIDEFYLGNSEFPDYPGNEWMKEEANDSS